MNDTLSPARPTPTNGIRRRTRRLADRLGLALRLALRRAVRAGSRPQAWRRGRVLAALALLLGLLLLLHADIPDGFGSVGSLVETFLPWLGLFVPVLLVLALWRRSASALVALLLPVVAWLSLFGGVLADKAHAAGAGAGAGTRVGGLMVVEQNVNAGNPDPAGTARDLAASGADLLALVELTPRAIPAYERGLASAYPYHSVEGTVGLWSKLPLSDTRTIDVMDFGPLAARKPAAAKLAENRALRITVATDHGPLTVYVAHLGSVRVNPRGGFSTTSRNIGIRALAQAVTGDPGGRVVLLGDLNGTTGDRAFAPLTSQLRSAQDTAGSGFGFTWPAAFPMVRIDQVLVRGVVPERSWVLPANSSDHLPVAADIRW